MWLFSYTDVVKVCRTTDASHTTFTYHIWYNFAPATSFFNAVAPENVRAPDIIILSVFVLLHIGRSEQEE